MSDTTLLLSHLALVRAEIGGKAYEFEARIGANLLGSALVHKAPIDHICRTGLCGACQVLVVSGAQNLSAPTDQERLLLDDVPLEQGVRLACQAKVMGELLIRHSKIKAR